ncbi:histidine kinase [Actinomycetes bacterium KLBMP 9759]
MIARLTAREWREDLLMAVGFLGVGTLLLVVAPEVAITWARGFDEATSLWPRLGVIAVASLGVTVRRANPIVGLLVLCATMLTSVVVIGNTPLGVMLVFGDLLYCAVRFTSRTASWAVAGASTAVIGGASVVSLVSDGGRAALLVSLNLMAALAVPVMWGREVRRHSELADIQRDRAEQAKRMSELDRKAAVTEERSRMARDLHDVIAGQLSAIAIQSEAALSIPDADNETLRKVLTSVRRNSVASLSEMRTMIGLLRADGSGDADPRTAPAGLDRIDALLDAGRDTGLTITVDDRRPPGVEIPAAVDLAAYRIVQESLINAAKHAPGSAARLTLEHAAGALVVTVANDLVPDAPPGGGTGTGLLGLRERAGAVGGSVEARADGTTWTTRAVLPVETKVAAGR